MNELKGLWKLFKSAPNFKEVNKRSGHGAFSASISCYARYLKEFKNNERKENALMSVQTNGDLQLVDFNKPELCAFTNPYECIIDGHLLFGEKERGKNWRDLLVLVCEYFLENEKEKMLSCQLPSGRYLLRKDRPNICVCRRLSNGFFIVVSEDIPNLIRFIGRISTHCGVSLNIRLPRKLSQLKV